MTRAMIALVVAAALLIAPWASDMQWWVALPYTVLLVYVFTLLLVIISKGGQRIDELEGRLDGKVAEVTDPFDPYRYGK